MSLPQFTKVINMATEGQGSGVHVMVLDAKFFARLANDGRNLHIVRLDDAREEVVGSLMIEGTSEHCPEPTVCGIVLSCGNLEFSPLWRGRDR